MESAASFPTAETAPQSPVSPYGVTKVAGEHLCRIYGKQHGLELTTLRFFTVYGPRQRPDMAFSHFISKALSDEPITVLGDGTQQRDFTYVDDIVEGCMLAARASGVGCFNLGGGAVYELNDVISQIEETLGRRIRVDYLPVAPGDVRSTSADIRRAGSELGYVPQVDFARPQAASGMAADCASVIHAQATGALIVRGLVTRPTRERAQLSGPTHRFGSPPRPQG